MNIKKLRQNKKGFTLIEIIVVIVILAVLMAVAVPSVLNYINEADDAKYMTQASGAVTAAQVQMAKAWTDGDDTTTNTTALDVAEASLTGTPTVNEIFVYSAAPTYAAANGGSITGGTLLVPNANPAGVVAYVVSMTDSGETKFALVTPNGTVQIADARTAPAAP